jgi:glycosyltransferase involved in cell wall biosynthesis
MERAGITVGFDQRNYGAARNCYAPMPEVNHKRSLRLPLEHVFGQKDWSTGIFLAPSTGRVDLLHTWNRVAFTAAGLWGVSFESVLPRMAPGRVAQWCLRRLENSRCRFIIGISDYAVQTLLGTLSETTASVLTPKLHRLYPPQEVHTSEPVRLDANEALHLGFVGGDFFLKGGLAALDAIDRFGESMNARATIIGRIEEADWGSMFVPPHELEVTRRRLRDNPRVEWIPTATRDEVDRMMSRCHVGLLPTVSDTFGYSSLEFMSHGVPVICSNVKALPEIVDGAVGWPAELELTDRGWWVGEPDWGSDANRRLDARYRQFDTAMDALSSHIGQVLEDVRADPSIIEVKSNRALGRVDERFSPPARAQHLLRIYRHALGM